MVKARIPLGHYITEYSVRNRNNEDIPVYSVTNSQGFCTEYFGKEVASQDKSTYKIVPWGYFAYNPSRINVGSVDWQRNNERVIVSPLYNVFSVSDELDRQYLYYFLKSDYGRQIIKEKASGSVRDNLKLDMLKEITIPNTTLDEQKECVSILDKIQSIVQFRQQELRKLDELVKARFVEMFGDLRTNPLCFEKKNLRDTCTVLTGNTPSRAIQAYYGDYIEWIKTDNIVSERQNPTEAVEYLSEDGMKVGRTVDKGSILMACIAGSVASIGNQSRRSII